jgi:hypothetical protein
MPTTPIRKITITSPSGTSTVLPVGAYAEDILMSDQAGADDLVTALGKKADSTDLPSDFTGATSSTAGAHGLVPAPAAGDEAKFLQGDGTWAAPAGGVSSVNGETGIVVLDAADVGALSTAVKGANSGVAELDATGKVPSSQLPSYVDDVVEAANFASLPATGETGKIYITLDDNKTYRWSGSAYVEISASLALGETSATAYRGDRGKNAYDHATETGRIGSATTEGFYKVASTAEGHIASLTAVAKSDITALGIPDENTEYDVTSDSIGSASAWSAGSVTNIVANGDSLDITIGTAPSLTITSTSVVTSVTEKT